MLQIRPASAAIGPLFCGEHQNVAASHVILSADLRMALCPDCMAELKEQTSLLLPRIRYSRSNWPVDLVR